MNQQQKNRQEKEQEAREEAEGQAEERLQRERWTVGRNKMLSRPEQQKLVDAASKGSRGRAQEPTEGTPER